MSNNEWVTKEIENICNGKQHKRCIQSGIDHLAGKKLYKYYSLSSDFTISNIKNGTVYLQNPVMFNDPFDCSIGISLDPVFRILITEVFDKILPNTNPNVRAILSSWILGDYLPDIDESSKEYLLSICSSSSTLMKLIDNAKSGQNVSDQEILSLFVEDSDSLSKIIQAYLSIGFKVDVLPFKDEEQVIKSSQIIRNLIFNLAQKSDSEEQKFLELLPSKDDFIEKIKVMASMADIDIPKSKIEEIYSTIDQPIIEIRNAIGKKMGIECFTQSPTDILMWSYYADKHTGVCVEYDFSKLFSTCSNAFLLPVSYSENRPLLDISNLFDPTTQEIYHDQIEEAMPSVIKSFVTKSKQWEHEKEWRLIAFSLKNDSERLVKLPIASRIIAGTKISQENYQMLADIAREKGIPLHKTRLKNDQYKIEILDA